MRLGLRQIEGLQEEEIGKLVAARASKPFRDVHELWARARVKLFTLEKLAAADAFRSVQAELGFAKTGLDRRQALWEVKALGAAEPLPLFSWSETREAAAEPFVQLPQMRLSEHVVNDYQTLRLSLKAHPMSFLRERFTARRVIACDELRGIKDGAYVSVAGVVLVRQRPGSAKGVVFMTIEDETGIANAVVWAKTLERFRKEVMASRLIVIHGRVQRHQDIIHVGSAKLEDRSDWLQILSAEAATMKAPLANADEVLRPDPGSAQPAKFPADPNANKMHPRWASHPRDARIIPKSRDFH
jgi:error-prone DNA polymerase